MTDRTKALVDGPPETIDGFEVGTTVAPNTTIVGDADLYDVPPEVEAIAAWNTRPASHEAELVEALEGLLAVHDMTQSPAGDRIAAWSGAVNAARAILAKAKAGAA